MHKWLFVTGIATIAVGIGLAMSVPFFYYRSNMVSGTLMENANQKFQAATEAAQKPVLIPTDLQVNTLLGELDIPKLSLQAPILEGTNDQEINVAVGHLTTSVLPGENGTSILAAHNATWFRHTDKLRPGDDITIKTSYGTFTFTVTGSRIVHVGTNVKNTTDPTLVLESCYPLNALYLTPYRYLVFAKIKNSGIAVSHHMEIKSGIYNAAIPNGLPSEDIQLADNSLPLGSLSYKGYPANSFIQSNAPLSASSALVSLYLAWQHATAEANSQFLHELEQENVNNHFLGIPVSQYRYDQKFNIRLNVEGTRLVSATATDIVTLSHTWLITVHAIAKGNNVILQSVNITPY